METDDERLERYILEGFHKEAMTDKYWVIRSIYFRKHGFTEEARTDEDWRIRLGYFQRNGFTIEALEDPNEEIRGEARKHYQDKEEKEGNPGTNMGGFCDLVCKPTPPSHGTATTYNKMEKKIITFSISVSNLVLFTSLLVFVVCFAVLKLNW